jgi:hypothetical protein
MLVWCLIEAPDELSADFQRFYQASDVHDVPLRLASAWCAAMIRQPESWTRRRLVPDWQWGLVSNQLLAAEVDALNVANWQRGNQGRKTASPRPKPVPRPGVKGDGAKSEVVSLPVDEVRRLLALPRVAADQ